MAEVSEWYEKLFLPMGFEFNRETDELSLAIYRKSILLFLTGVDSVD